MLFPPTSPREREGGREKEGERALWGSWLTRCIPAAVRVFVYARSQLGTAHRPDRRQVLSDWVLAVGELLVVRGHARGARPRP